MGFFSFGWFIITLVGLIGTGVAIYLYTVRKPVEWWVWALLILGLVVAIIGVLIGVYQYEEKIAWVKQENLRYEETKPDYLRGYNLQGYKHIYHSGQPEIVSGSTGTKIFYRSQ